MEAQPQRGSPAAACYPRWVLLEQYMEIKVEGSSSACSPTTGDTKTLAAARTSAGHPIQVSLRLAEPPALSRVLVRIPAGLKEEKSKVLAAHGDSMLIQLRIKEKHQRHHTFEHFVYSAGAATAADDQQPPSLWLLPPYYEKEHFSGSDDLVPRQLSGNATGLLHRRGGGGGGDGEELVVVELSEDGTPGVGVVFMFRSDEWKWKYCCFKIKEGWDLRPALLDTVVPVDDRLLCWVDLSRGVVLFDAFRETPTVRYVRLPTAPRRPVRFSRNVCATAAAAAGGGGGALKFVNVFGRCCCGAAAASCDCEHARHAYTIQTWKMRIHGGIGGGMEWVQDGMVDCTELWALDAYKGLPRDDPLDRPIVSTDEPEVICFRLRDTKCSSRTIWQIMVDMRSKTIRSVSRHEEELGYCYARDKLIPSKVSCFFNTYPTSDEQATLARRRRQSQADDIIERPPPSSLVIDEEKKIGDGGCLQASEIFQMLQEIPRYGLLGADEVKAYRILSGDNGRRLRSLIRLPKNLRKNWLMIEIKANQD